jgi:mannose-1-phosphate guanylyltransferase
MKTIPVILAGGKGERFWPLSRSYRPKQVLPLFSPKTMIEETIARVTAACGGTTPLVVTGKDCAAGIKKALPDRLVYDCIVEPVGKNTAPAIALSAAWIRARYHDAVMLVASADHAIAPVRSFVSAVRSAVSVARADNSLVVFGIPPTRPDVGYGYINIGKKLSSKNGTACHAVRRFVEKPSQAVARQYMKSGKYLWNSGMFVWKVSVILEEFQRHMPVLYQQVCTAEKAGFTKRSIDAFYGACEKESIDYGIMEKSRRIVAVKGMFFWDDIGSWEAMARIHPKNKNGTVVIGSSVLESDCMDSIVYNASPLHVASIGITDTVLVVTPDAVLAIARPLLPEIKKYLGMMKDKKFPQSLF